MKKQVHRLSIIIASANPAATFLLGANGKVTEGGDFVFYNNLKHKSGAVEHMGDNLTGEGEDDDEQIKIDLSKVPANIEKIAFTEETPRKPLVSAMGMNRRKICLKTFYISDKLLLKMSRGKIRLFVNKMVGASTIVGNLVRLNFLSKG